MTNPSYRTETLDLELLKNRAFVERLAQIPPRSVLYSEEKALKVARRLVQGIENVKSPKIRSVSLRIALKAIRVPRILHALFSEGHGADIASVGELEICLNPYFADVLSLDRVSYSNVSQSKQDMQTAVQLGVFHFVVDDKNSIDWLAEAATKFGKRLQVLLRVGLNSADQGRHGIPADELQNLALYARQNGIEVSGLAYHVGTYNRLPYAPKGQEELSFQKYGNAVRAVAGVRNDLVAKGLMGPIFNIEGGLAASYGPPEFDMEDVLASIAKAIEECIDGPVDVIEEPGRPLNVCAAGKIVVNNIKIFPGNPRPLVILGLSRHHGYDVFYLPPTFFLLDDLLQGKIVTPYTHPQECMICKTSGDSCSGSDIPGKGDEYARPNSTDIYLPKNVKAGDILIALPCGTYMSAYSSPQTMQELEHRFVGPEKGFNGLPNYWDWVF